MLEWDEQHEETEFQVQVFDVHTGATTVVLVTARSKKEATEKVLKAMTGQVPMKGGMT